MVDNFINKVELNKKTVFLFFTLLVFLFVFFVPVKTVDAQSCICGSGGARCVVKAPIDSCGTGFHPVCEPGVGVCGGCICVSNAIGNNCKDSGVIKFSKLEIITLPAGLACGDLSTVIQRSYPYIFEAGGVALVIYILYGGFRMMLAQGDPKTIAAGRQAVIYGIIGLLLIFAAYWIVIVVGDFFGLTGFGDVFVD